MRISKLLRRGVPPSPPQVRPGLILHVGRHKTGSSSLQRLFSQQEDVLRHHSLLYPRTGRVGDQHLALAAAALGGHPALPASPLPELEALLDSLEQEEAQAGVRYGLLSSEVFCELAFRQPGTCRALLDRLAARHGNHIWVFQVVRNPHDYGVSAVKHQLRHDGLGPWSPLDWYRRCQLKHSTLNAFWSDCGVPLLTLPYDPTTLAASFLETLERIGEAPGLATDLAGAEGGSVQKARINRDPEPSGSYILFLMHQARSLRGAALTYPRFRQWLLESPSVRVDAVGPAQEAELRAALNELFARCPLEGSDAEEDRRYLETSQAFALMEEAFGALGSPPDQRHQ